MSACDICHAYSLKSEPAVEAKQLHKVTAVQATSPAAVRQRSESFTNSLTV